MCTINYFSIHIQLDIHEYSTFITIVNNTINKSYFIGAFWAAFFFIYIHRTGTTGSKHITVYNYVKFKKKKKKDSMSVGVCQTIF